MRCIIKSIIQVSEGSIPVSKLLVWDMYKRETGNYSDTKDMGT